MIIPAMGLSLEVTETAGFDKKKSLKRVALNAILFGAIFILVLSVIVEIILFIYPTLENYKREMIHEGNFACTLIGSEYVEDIFNRTKEIYYSVPDDVREQEFSDEYRGLLIPLVDEEFLAARKILVKCRENAEMGNVALTFFDNERENLVFVLDGNLAERAFLPGQYLNNRVGTIDSLDTINRILDSSWYMRVTYGKIDGFMATNYSAIRDSKGELIGYTAITIPINAFVDQIKIFLSVYIPVMLVIIGFFSYNVAKQANIRLIRPINSMAGAARKYTAMDKNGDGTEAGVFKDLNIATGDEIEELWETMVEMEDDVAGAMQKIRASAAKEERLATELELAKRIQLSALPTRFPAFEGEKRFDIYARMTPAKEVGGDFYDFFMIDDDHLCMVIADVSGKGVPAALFMMNSKTILKNRTLQGGTPAEILSYANDAICEDNTNDMFVTVWLGILTLSTGEVIASNAGHEYPYITDESGKYNVFMEPHGVVVGGFEGMVYKDYTFKLEKGGRLFVYTDGVPEAQNGSEEFFGRERISMSLNSHFEASPEDLIAAVKSDVDDFAGSAEQFDDITMLNIVYYG